MEETRDDSGSMAHGPSNSTWWTQDFMEKFGSVSLGSQEEILSNKESPRNSEQDGLSFQTASQILWNTGMLSEPIPNGFYSVIPVIVQDNVKGSLVVCNRVLLPPQYVIYPEAMHSYKGSPSVTLMMENLEIWLEHQSVSSHAEDGALVIVSLANNEDKRLKELYDDIPTLDELHALGGEGFKADIILVDATKDKKLSMLKQLIVASVKGLNSNPAAMIKKIAGLVSEFYKRPNVESPAKAALEDSSHMFDTRGVQLLGQIRHGSCRPRAIMFKVLADTVGLESRLMVGLPSDGAVECVDSDKHMSVIVVLNSVEMLVDLMRFPGQLIPRSTKAIFMTHISAAGESDSAENDSCDSPLEPNSPLYGFPERVDPDSAEKDESLHFHRKLEASSNVPGPSLRSKMFRHTASFDRKLSLSHSEPNIATTFWRRSRRKVIAEQRTASSRLAVAVQLTSNKHLMGGSSTWLKYPEHPSFRARGRSMLSGDRNSIGDYTDDVATSRSDGASMSEARRLRRRSISITPEISDDIVRAVRAMNETLKQNRLLRERGEDGSFSSNDRDNTSDLQKDVCVRLSEEKPLNNGGLSPATSLLEDLYSFGDDDIVGSVSPSSSLLSEAMCIVSVAFCFGNDLKKNMRPSSDAAVEIQCIFSKMYVTLDLSELGVSNLHLSGHDSISGGRSVLYNLSGGQINSQKAISLPSSPHQYRSHAAERGGSSGYMVNAELVSTWNKVLESPMFQNKPLLAYEEWSIDFSELTVGTRVGIGFFGEVFRGIWNGTEVAIKVFLEQDLTAENMEDFCNEISILRNGRVILFLGACAKPPRLSMVTEYMEMGSLYYLIHLSGQKKKLSWRRRLKMLRDICRGLMCIHRMKIVHRDLKSANCLVNKHWTVKICDFGLSRIMTDSPIRDSSSAGTPEWMAPELIRNEPFTEKCDIFSFGVIMWELYTLNRPWEGVLPERVVYAVANERSRLEIPEGPLGRLISDCWADPQERPSCEEILSRLLDCEYSLC
ncbi:hypothetical protein EZV62_020288 [Acer yangbiense]|uniref:Protein kinase domain-containing protein n=1 Tax=Acer yangbiense TaxID=1000413 RepID=A0A5C7HF05_9ROSI|nr:hypothetical protein EZV62_020288 [Acer yangbiense]